MIRSAETKRPIHLGGQEREHAELVWHDRHLAGFENRLKDDDRIRFAYRERVHQGSFGRMVCIPCITGEDLAATHRSAAST